MDTLAKLQLLSSQMSLEPAEELPTHTLAPPSPTPNPQPPTPTVAPCGQVITPSSLPPKQDSLGIYHAAVPGRRPIALLKTLLTSACERNCYYCPFRAGRNYRRATFKPDEMAQTFMDLYRAGRAEGLFLSSGIIKGGVTTQDKIIDTAAILREKYAFRGYLHLKIMPGAERDQVQRLMQLADRVSVNLEAPNTQRLQRLAPRKQFVEELLQPLRWVEEIRRSQSPHHTWNGRWPSSVTQFVVGAVGESDLELLTTAAYLYNQLHLRHTYFSGFSPVLGTPLENQPAADPWREHRLYQSSFLLRDYGFDLEELPFTPDGNLPLAVDPKVAWAQSHLAYSPIEVNRAGRDQLLRVPGVGPKGVEAILAARRQGKLRDLHDLQRIGVITARAAPYILLDGRRPLRQLNLFGHG